MKITFLGKVTQGGNSPTLWQTDDDQYILRDSPWMPKPWTRSEPYQMGRLSFASRSS